ncbi:MAG: DedA family protein [Anaerolineae bacterium]
MAALLDQIRIIIEQIILTIGYPGLALVIFIENVFTPIPSEVVLPFAGFLVSSGKFTLPGVLFWSTLGAVLGAIALYYIGLWADEPVVRGFTRRYGRYIALTEKDLDRAMAWFDRYGQAVIFFGRLIPLVRSLISLPAGMNRMRLPRFLLFTTLGSLLWNVVLSGAGYLLGENWESILDIVDKYEKVWLVLLGVGFVAFVVHRVLEWRKRKAVSSGSMTPVD